MAGGVVFIVAFEALEGPGAWGPRIVGAVGGAITGAIVGDIFVPGGGAVVGGAAGIAMGLGMDAIGDAAEGSP